MAKLPLGWLQLKYQKTRLLVAIGGVAFAVILVLMQLGFQDALLDSGVTYHRNLDYELVLINPKSPFIVYLFPFSQRRLYQTLAVDGVASVAPIYASVGSLKNPDTNEIKGLYVVGFDPSDRVWKLPAVNENLDKIKQEDVVLFDETSLPAFGPIPEIFRNSGPVTRELNYREVTIAGLFSLGTSFGIDGTILTSDTNFLRIFPARQRGLIDIGLIQLEPDADPVAVAEKVDALLPDDVIVLTRDQFIQREIDYWNATTPIGYVFSMGVIVGFFVGSIIVYQILFADVSEHLPEYATLKAIGYSNLSLAKVVLQQAFILGILGFIPGILISWQLYAAARTATNLPLILTTHRVLQVLGLAIAMCAGSGMLALRRVWVADPADIF